MPLPPRGSVLRSYRFKALFSQRELAEILGLVSAAQVSRHERSVTIPSLLGAISYEVLFKVPIAELFPGIYETVQQKVEASLAQMEHELQQSTAKGQKASRIAFRLEWAEMRRSGEPRS